MSSLTKVTNYKWLLSRSQPVASTLTVPFWPDINNTMLKKSMLALVITTGISTHALAAQSPCNNLDFQAPDRLFKAVAHKCSISVGEMLKMEADPNVTDYQYATPLMHASIDDQSSIAGQLIEAGATVNATTGAGISALMLAAENASIRVVKQLLAANADPNQFADNGMTALMYAIKNNHSAVAEILIEAKSNLNLVDERGYTALMMASWAGNIELVEHLVNAGAHVDTQTTNGYNAQTALIFASDKGYTDIVKALLKANPRSYIRDNFGKSPLDYAMENNHKDIVSLLEQYQPPAYSVLPRDREICLQAQTQQKQQPLIYAIAHGCAETVNKLLSDGVNPNIINGYGQTALMMAATHKDPVIANLLINAKADVNAAHPEYGTTALMSASARGALEVVELLLKAGLRGIDVKDKYGDTALVHAIFDDHAVIVERLVNAGASLNIKGRYKLSPLMHASLGSPEVVKYLLKIGVDVNQQDDKTGETALMIASDRGEHYIITLLARAGAELEIKNNKGQTALDMAKSRMNNQGSVVRLNMARYEQLVPRLHQLLERGTPLSAPEVRQLAAEITKVAPIDGRAPQFERNYLQDRESMLSLPTDAFTLRRRF